MTAIDTFTQALAQHNCGPRNSQAKCPAHEDDHPSLSFTEGTRGVVFHCHAGCEATNILDALKLRWRDVYDQPLEVGTGETVYPYASADGELLYQVVRGDNKRFTQRRPVGERWEYNLNGIGRTIYRLPEVLKACNAGAEIWVVEGEKDVDRIRAEGVTATCNSGGAGKWSPRFGQLLAGASVVNVVADRDTAGRAHAHLVAASITDGTPVRLWEPLEGKDISDHLAAGRGLSELVSLDGGTPPNPFTAALLDEAALANLEPPEPLVDDWLFRKSVAFLLGPPKKGKTFVALDIAMSVATGIDWFGQTPTARGHVLYILGEGVSGLGRRVSAWRHAHPEAGKADIEFLPVPAQLRDAQHVEWLIDMVADRDPVLVIIDTLARSIVGTEENSAKDMGEAVASLDALKASCGACVLVVHHTGKDTSRGARGSSALNGAWDTAITIGVTDRGETVMTNWEQKEAESGQQLGLRFDQHLDSIAVRRIDVPPNTGRDPVAVAKQTLISVTRRARSDKPMSRESWLARGTGTATHLRAAFNELVEDGMFIAVEVRVHEAGPGHRDLPRTHYRVSEKMMEAP